MSTNLTVNEQCVSVIVMEEDGNHIVVSSPVISSLVIDSTGPQGPPGSSAAAQSVLIDTTTLGTIYVGRAASGSSEGESVWTIVRTIYSTAGIRTSKGTSVNVAWTGRASATYS
jgi:hypothetical protein